MLRMLWAVRCLQQFELMFSNVEQIGGHGGVLYKENNESAADCKKNEPRKDADCGYLQETGDNNTADVFEVHGSRLEGNNLQKDFVLAAIEVTIATGRQRILFMVAGLRRHWRIQSVGTESCSKRQHR